ncbi:DUF4350 domain-containing protein [Sphingobacterium corticibacterium]|uniref:DUF4350 domain-containing protein n=1 Tax=Sphingobacterium corticibacterium TaxID=2484746 RepID=A0A4Q6XLV7_9SPHI|nr:DUF4350 domain-containing protein [Sphingobacterium corticibacterium]RZF58342.1 DUF4350 domain-containing protein [Sphingobacterium corticibacterium]
MVRNRAIYIFIAVQLVFSSAKVSGQQVSDTSFDPKIAIPTHPIGEGPRVYIDEGHHNFHTLDGRYSTFANLLRAYGYQVDSRKGEITFENLHGTDVLVIANALNEFNVNNWSKPIHQAFSGSEIAAIKSWVAQGGSLFLIADHMPFPGAVDSLASAFGFSVLDGFARDAVKIAKRVGGPDVFSIQEGTLSKHLAAQGKDNTQNVDSIATFGGQAFEIPDNAISLITLPDRFHILLPDTAWKFSPSTHSVNVGGFSQGAVLEFGKGRMALFGEAAMFSAQFSGKDKRPMGINHPKAKGNISFIRNILYWLTVVDKE